MINQIINDIRFIRKIDLGGFSSVWLAVHEVTHKQLAVKVIPKYLNFDLNNIEKAGINISTTENDEKKSVSDFESQNTQKDEKDNVNTDDDKSNLRKIDFKKKSHFETEINILSKIDHPLVLGYFGSFEDDSNLYICMEYVPNGSLLDYINTNSTTGGIKEIVARRFFTELLIVIEYLHKQLKIFHRDLKCENVLIDANSNIRLIDFGFSVIYQNSNDHFTDKFGSSGYTCPEMINNISYTPEKSDIWCLGVILYSMLVGKLPFDGNNDIETAEKIAYEEPEYPSYLSKNSVDLLKRILTKNPYRRIDIDSIKRHPFLSQTELLIISRVNPPKSNLSLDEDILFELSMNDKVSITKLTQQNASEKFNKELLMYKQLKRARDTKLLQEVAEGKIVSFDKKRTKKCCEFHINDTEKQQENMFQESDSELLMMPSSSSMPFSNYGSQQFNSKIKSNYYKNSYVSNPDLRNQHDHRHIPHPDIKKTNNDSATSNSNLNLEPSVDNPFCDHFVEDTIIDDDDEYDQNSNLNVPKQHFGNTRGGISTPNFLSFKTPSESENENDSEGINNGNSRSSHSHSRQKHKSKSKKSTKTQSTDNISIPFPSTSFSVSSLSNFSKDQSDPNYPKKDLIRIAPRKRSKVSSNNPKAILSFIH